MAPTHVTVFSRDSLPEIFLTPMFAGLANTDVEALLRGSRVEVFGDRQLLFSERDEAKDLFLMLDGHVEIFIRQGRRRIVVEVAKKLSILGESALFSDGRHPHWARSVGHAKVLTIPAAPIIEAMDQNFDLALRMLRTQSIRLRGLVEQISRLKLKSTAQRLAGFLLGLTDKNEGPVSVRFPYDKRLAAEALGMTAESLSRALTRLAMIGVDSRSENMVFIPDLRALQQFVSDEGG